MKSIILVMFLLVAGSTIGLAQCDKKVSLVSSKTQHLDSGGATKETVDEKTTIEFNKSDITVSIVNDNGDQKMTGTINSNVCNWTVPFKEGKTTMHITLKRDDGETRDFDVTIEGKDGKITLLAANKEMKEGQIKLDIEKFEEKN
ncbi:MAG: hypothetical protein ACXVB0_04630 [Mucilaginibacter sp.]